MELFQRILVPVDFSINTDVAIAKALDHCGPATEVHLFHLRRPSGSGWMHALRRAITGSTARQEKADTKMIEMKLESLRSDMSGHISGSSAYWGLENGNDLEQSIIQRALTIHADLIIIGQSSHAWLPFRRTLHPGRISRSASIPVLTVKPGCMQFPLKTVVVPVGSRYPRQKIEMVEALRKQSRLHIRLVTFLEDEKDPAYTRSGFLNAYRMLKNNLTTVVDYDVLPGTNRSRALLTYCQKVHADIVLVNSAIEEGSGPWNQHITASIPPGSRTQVLCIPLAKDIAN